MIRKGDKVRVTRKPTKEELENWQESWIEDRMDKSVGSAFTVLEFEFGSTRLRDGIGSFLYPNCVLEKLEE